MSAVESSSKPKGPSLSFKKKKKKKKKGKKFLFDFFFFFFVFVIIVSGEAVVNAVKQILLQTKTIKSALSEAPALRDVPLFADECKKTGVNQFTHWLFEVICASRPAPLLFFFFFFFFFLVFSPFVNIC
jgi:hypothetical protein